MQFLADENCDSAIICALREAGHKVVSVSESFRGCEDEKLLELARQEKWLFITEDKDFGELVFAHQRKTGGVILVRFPLQARKNIVPALLKLISEKGDKLISKFIVVQPNRIRII